MSFCNFAVFLCNSLFKYRFNKQIKKKEKIAKFSMIA